MCGIRRQHFEIEIIPVGVCTVFRHWVFRNLLSDLESSRKVDYFLHAQVWEVSACTILLLRMQSSLPPFCSFRCPDAHCKICETIFAIKNDPETMRLISSDAFQHEHRLQVDICTSDNNAAFTKFAMEVCGLPHNRCFSHLTGIQQQQRTHVKFFENEENYDKIGRAHVWTPVTL